MNLIFSDGRLGIVRQRANIFAAVFLLKLGLGFLNKLGLLHGFDAGKSHYLRRSEHTLHAYIRTGEGCVLPGMAHIAQTGRCHIQHNGGCGIAHIAHVGRAGFVAELSGVEGMYLLIQRLFQHITDVIPVKELSELGLDIAESIFIIASEQ